jgi:hypothetical protein
VLHDEPVALSQAFLSVYGFLDFVNRQRLWVGMLGDMATQSRGHGTPPENGLWTSC